MEEKKLFEIYNNPDFVINIYGKNEQEAIETLINDDEKLFKMTTIFNKCCDICVHCKKGKKCVRNTSLEHLKEHTIEEKRIFIQDNFTVEEIKNEIL